MLTFAFHTNLTRNAKKIIAKCIKKNCKELLGVLSKLNWLKEIISRILIVGKKTRNLCGMLKRFLKKIHTFLFTRLQVLGMGGNCLTEVPSTLGKLRTLQALVLCDNMLESLPGSIANLKNLKSLLLHKNRLKTLPTEIITLKNLTELSLRDNPLVVRFVSDMTHNPPSLLEVAARTIKTTSINYNEFELPRNLIDYLDSSHHCVNPRCKG